MDFSNGVLPTEVVDDIWKRAIMMGPPDDTTHREALTTMNDEFSSRFYPYEDRPRRWRGVMWSAGGSWFVYHTHPLHYIVPAPPKIDERGRIIWADDSFM